MFDLAVFITAQTEGTASLFSLIDAIVEPHAVARQLKRWHPYLTESPYACVEHIPLAFIAGDGTWHQHDPEQEKPAQRLVQKRQQTFASDRGGAGMPSRNGSRTCSGQNGLLGS